MTDGPVLNGKELHDLLWKVVADAPADHRARYPHWRMNLAWYKAIRRAYLREDADEADRNEAKWEPQPGDTILGYRITVAEDGGVPHLIEGRLEASYD